MKTGPFEDRRIGFILASIHTGSSLNLWTSLAGEAEKAGGAFFVFPGGRLNSRPDSEFLRNSVYSLANRENLDGLISWGSSIGGAVTMEEMNRFHESLEPLPYVTIAHKMKEHPCVSFDAYTGMKALVTHFIREHGSRRIAFLRGPAFHVSAGDRYRAYREALIGQGLPDPEDSPLVSTPFPWSAGEAAAVQLYETRGLVPGQDFDALIGASDMMVFSALQYLQRAGFSVPGDFLAGGFNNSAESRIVPAPLSTVHMPYGELGLEAFRMIRRIIGENPREAEDLVLPSQTVIRESCGCRRLFLDAASGNPWAGSPVEKRERLLAELAELYRLDETDQNALLFPLFGALEAGNPVLFMNLLEKVLVRFYREERETRLIFQGMDLIRESGCFPRRLLKRLELPVLRAAGQIQSRVFALKNYEKTRLSGVMNALKRDLLCARDRDSLIRILAEHLPRAGIHTAVLAVYQDQEFSRIVGGFSPEVPVSVTDELFPASLLLPESLASLCRRGVFLVQPLFMENQSLGYLVCNVPFHDGGVFEDLRSAVSSVLKGVHLFEEATAAKQRAEQAERAKTRFFAHVGGELGDPLQEILEELQKLEARETGSAGIAGEGLLKRESLRKIREEVGRQREKISRLIDLTLSELNELSFDNRLFLPDRLFPEGSGFLPEQLPLLFGDPERLGQAMKILTRMCPDGIRASCTPRGFSVRLESRNPLSGEDWQRGDALLARNLVSLQYGEITGDPEGCSLVFPWPNLAGLPPESAAPSPEGILAFNPGLPLEDLGIPAVNVPREEGYSLQNLDDQPLVIAWDPRSAPLTDWIRIYSLRNHPRLFRTPFLCFDPEFAGSTLLAVIQERVREKRRGPILFVTGIRGNFSRWAGEDNSLTIPSMDEFAAAAEEMKPSLVVLPECDASAVEEIRRFPATVLVPILVLPERIPGEEGMGCLGSVPHVLLCHRCVAETADFSGRIRNLLSGDELLPPHTGALVKKALGYFDQYACSQISRWQLAGAVNVSEDYLTRIFHRELGLSPWEYLNVFRIHLAADRLLHTDDSIHAVAASTGFQDQAYFCRVFKKIYRLSPGKFRSQGETLPDQMSE